MFGVEKQRFPSVTQHFNSQTDCLVSPERWHLDTGSEAGQ